MVIIKPGRRGIVAFMTLEEARKLLGLGQLASRQEIRSAYRQEARRWHPDLAVNDIQEAEYRQRMQQVNLAYQRILQFIEGHRFELVENSSQEDLMQWWHNRFATGSWSPPPTEDPGGNK
ncbi:MAG: J domain-containing protein, partial [Deltaproteobacteria bacterium]|nr:J domain-containing protein [Deltaproteobacteria bacterium]